jgi:hypothetical protein
MASTTGNAAAPLSDAAQAAPPASIEEKRTTTVEDVDDAPDPDEDDLDDLDGKKPTARTAWRAIN